MSPSKTRVRGYSAAQHRLSIRSPPRRVIEALMFERDRLQASSEYQQHTIRQASFTRVINWLQEQIK